MLYIFAFCVGLALCVQAPINAALGRSLHAPLFAAFISFSIGTFALLVLCYFNGALQISTLKASFTQEWWKYLGGFLGAFAVFMTLFLAPKIGLVNLFLLIILGQILTSIVLDHFGAFSLPKKHLTLQQIIALIVIFTGFLLFFYKDLFKA